MLVVAIKIKLYVKTFQFVNRHQVEKKKSFVSNRHDKITPAQK